MIGNAVDVAIVVASLLWLLSPSAFTSRWGPWGIFIYLAGMIVLVHVWHLHRLLYAIVGPVVFGLGRLIFRRKVVLPTAPEISPVHPQVRMVSGTPLTGETHSTAQLSVTLWESGDPVLREAAERMADLDNVLLRAELAGQLDHCRYYSDSQGVWRCQEHGQFPSPCPYSPRLVLGMEEIDDRSDQR